MNTALTIPEPAHQIVAVFDDLGDNTKRAYLQSWNHFAAFLEKESFGDAVRAIIEAGQGGANFAVMRYRKHLLDSGIAASTAKTRLGAICGIIKRCRRIGLCNWALDIEAIHTESMRGVADNPLRGVSAGPMNDLSAIFAKLDKEKPADARDGAIIELLYNPALRRAECARLNVSDIDWVNSRLSILGKGRHESEWVPLPEAARRAISEWMKFRTDAPGPLFTRLDRDAAGQLLRLSDTALYKIVRDRAKDVGLKAWPHCLRHCGITDVASVTNGNLVATAGFARHKSMNVTMIYVDNVNDQSKAASRAIDGMRA